MLHRKIEGGYIIGDEYGQVKQILIVRFVCLRARAAQVHQALKHANL